MIKVTLSYPREPGATFDEGYYLSVHAPFSRQTFEQFGMVRSELELVIRQVRADVPDVFAVTSQYWHSVEDAERAFGSDEVAAVRADAHKFYSGVPTVRFSKVYAIDDAEPTAQP
jgi:uncharacterized protein (TIGR02118 family)